MQAIPASLLNSTATIYREVNTKGSMGQTVQRLVFVATVKCRCDFKSQARDTSPIEETAQTFRVYMPGMWYLTTSNWIKIATPSGRTETGQVTTCADPGGMGHHTAINMLVRSPLPPVTS